MDTCTKQKITHRHATYDIDFGDATHLTVKAAAHLILIGRIEGNFGNLRRFITDSKHISNCELGELKQSDLRCVTSAVPAENWNILLARLEFSSEMSQVRRFHFPYTSEISTDKGLSKQDTAHRVQVLE